MIVDVCDVCLKEGKITSAPWQLVRKGRAGIIRLDVCDDHKGYAAEHNDQELISLVRNVELLYVTLLNGVIRRKSSKKRNSGNPSRQRRLVAA